MDISPSQATTIRLPNELTVAQAGEYHRRLTALFDQGDDIVVDAGDVTRIDAASLQLIYVFQQALIETGGGIRWLAVSEAFVESAGLLGLTESLALPKAA